ncbi:MAG: amino acid adenylation domain-containing protein [Alphaproteobacteria bacterium]
MTAFHSNATNIPITTTQNLILTGQQIQPLDPLYNMVMVYRIAGAISPVHFRLAFDTLVNNCDAMRIVFTDLDTQAKQHVLDEIEYKVEQVDFSGQSDPLASYKNWESERKLINFNLSKCLFDCALITLSDTDYIWYFNQHHLATDAWSTEVTYHYVAHCYYLAERDQIENAEGLGSFSEHALQEADKLAKRLASEKPNKRFSRAQEYWTNKLDKPVIPSKFYRAVPLKKSSITLRHKCDFGEERSAKFRALLSKDSFAAFSTDLGLMQLFATVLYSYLHRINGNNILSIGTPCHSRTTVKLKQTPGLLINIFPLQVDIQTDETFASLYQKVAQANQELLINAVPGANEVTHNHAFDVVLNYITASFGNFDGLPMTSDWVHPDSGDRNHLMRLQVQNFDEERAITLFFDLNIDAFQGQETNWVMEHFLKLVDAFLDNPEQDITKPKLVDSLADQSINQFSKIVDASQDKTGSSTVLELFEQSLESHLQKTALVSGETSVSFDQLNAQSDILARYLVQQGLVSRFSDCETEGSTNCPPIAVFMDRSIQSVIAILGILKAGATFLPVDVHYPESRAAYILSDAKVDLIISCEEYTEALSGFDQAKLLIDKQWSTIANTISGLASTDSTLPTVSSQGIAYVIYTSGSTGLPKGVEVTHGGLHNYLSWARQYYLQGAVLDFPLFSSLSFDLTITSLFLPLISGGKLVIYSESADASDITIRNVIEDNRVDIIKLTPAHLTLIQNMDLSASKLKKLVVGGDDFKTELALNLDKYFAGNIELYNEYGPTEATVACTVHRFNPLVDTAASVPIGTPIDNASIYILDNQLNAVPQGVVGEIYIAGKGLAKGYLHQEELTNERFIYYPTNAATAQNKPLRLYKTGDLASFNSNGVLEYWGRNDHQVKIRGVRIETGEIEAALLGMPNIQDTIVDIASRLGLQGSNEDTLLEVEHCTQCGLAANHPSAQLDAEKVCRICRIYEKQSAQAQAYYQDLPALQARINNIKARSSGKQDSIMLLSGGKDSSYTLCKLVDMGLTPVCFTLDNGYISDGAKANIKRLVERLGLELVVGETEAMDDIFVDSLKRFSNVCNGCFKTIYTMSMKLAKERGISVICTGLSRGQIFETRVAHLFQQGCFSADKIDERIIEARKAYHRTDDIISRRLDVQVFQDDEIFEQIQYLDYFRYADVTLTEMYDYLNNIAPWIRPSDTGRSTNCLINDAGIYVHKKERGYHNYALPYSWDVRLGHKERAAALDELNDELDQQKVDDILKQVGYKYQKPNTSLSTEDVLVAYYAGPAEVQKNTLQSHLAQTLPKEYIPSQFIWLKELPLTKNGKVDRNALPKPQQSTRELTVDYLAPSSEVETTLAGLWGQLLGVKEVGIADNFFDLGGDSIVNIQIVAAARESGIDISPQQVFDYPTIEALAQVAGTTQVYKAEQGSVSGKLSLLPVQKRFFETNYESIEDANQFVQCVTLQYDEDFSTPILKRAFFALLQQHDGLRSKFIQSDLGWQQQVLTDAVIDVAEIKLGAHENLDDIIAQQRAALIEQLDITQGQLVGVSNIVSEVQNIRYLVIVINHLVVDGVSWWILLGDLAKCCRQIVKQHTIQLPQKSCSVIQWSQALGEYVNGKDANAAKNYWTHKHNPQGQPAAQTLSNKNEHVQFMLSEADTKLLSHEVPSRFSVQVPDVLLAALTCCKAWFAEHSLANIDGDLLVDIEGHGREDIINGLEVMRTVAWFTSIFPLSLNANSGSQDGSKGLSNLGEALRITKDQVRGVPNRGIDYGLLHYLSDDDSVAQVLSAQPQAQLLFNYMGQWERTLESDSPFSFVSPISAHHCKNVLNQYAMEINVMIFDEQLQVNLTYDSTLFNSEALGRFAQQYKQMLSDLIQYCMEAQSSGISPSDFPSANIDQGDLADIFAEFGED